MELSVGLTGIVWTLIQKSTGMVPPFLRLIFFYRLKQASGYMGSHDEQTNTANLLSSQFLKDSSGKLSQP